MKLKLEQDKKIDDKAKLISKLLSELQHDEYDDHWEDERMHSLSYYNQHNLKRARTVRNLIKNADNKSWKLDLIEFPPKFSNDGKSNSKLENINPFKNKCHPKAVKTTFKPRTINKFKGLSGLLFSC